MFSNSLNASCFLCCLFQLKPRSVWMFDFDRLTRKSKLLWSISRPSRQHGAWYYFKSVTVAERDFQNILNRNEPKYFHHTGFDSPKNILWKIKTTLRSAVSAWNITSDSLVPLYVATSQACLMQSSFLNVDNCNDGNGDDDDFRKYLKKNATGRCEKEED